jgi:hypothetical protein
MIDPVRPSIVTSMTEMPIADPASPASDQAAAGAGALLEPDPVDPDPLDLDPLDLDAVEADLAMVESTLADLAAGTYFASSAGVDAD